MLLQITGLIAFSILAQAQRRAECILSESCIPIRSCDAIVDQLKEAKTTSDREKKRNIIAYVRTKICGDLNDKLICCPNKETSPYPAAPPQQQQPVYLGEFVNIFHNVAGSVFAVSDNQIIIKGFTYDGEGPDAFFMAGDSGKSPNARATNGQIVLPYPYTGRHYQYLDKDVPILPAFDGTQDVLLTLPPGISVSTLRWISVWCRDYKVNFGHATFQ